MPYIAKHRRTPTVRREPQTPGELNWAITLLVLEYLKRNNTTYSVIAEITGVLENVKQEFYRRVASSYEDAKARENGDVYGE